MKYCATCNTVYPADFQCCPKDGVALSCSSELLPGMVIRDKYQILKQLGAGGMATVYQVRHLAFDEIRAIKLINNQLADDDQIIKRLRSEAVTARKLHHPNAVRVDDLDRTEEGRPFIVMEYVEGRNLRTVIRQEGPLPALRALSIAAQTASALAAAHKLGITHRDIKPDNIHLIPMPDGSDFVKVLDFGIAKFTQALSASGPLTASGLLVGTPQYVSPEQVMGKQGVEVDGRSDLYALGIVLYEMLTGRLPFESDTPVGLLVHHLHTAPIPPHELRPDLGIPRSVSAVLMKALEKDPDQRFRDAQEMRGAILSVEKQIKQPEQGGTVAWPAEVPAEIIKAPAPERIPPTRDAMPVEPAGFQGTPPSDATGLPSLFLEPELTSEAPDLIDSREELLRAAYEEPPSHRMLYWGITAFVIVCLAGLAIYQRHVPSEKAPGKPAPEAHELLVPTPAAETSASPPPATNTSLPAAPTQPSNAVRPAPNSNSLLSSPDPHEQEKLAKIKELVSQGRALSDQGEYQAAIDMFDAALRLDPQNSEAKAGKRKANERRELEQALPDENN